jgi:3-phenylpropionate/trans-cinnamate dioxygenase ferredoxin reductase subunit
MNADLGSVVIIGGGQAGYETAMSLRSGGFQEPVRIIGEEPYLPYQRPPLSKEPVTAERIESLAFTSAEMIARNNIDILTSTRVTAIDRQARNVTLSDGSRLTFGKLVIATGARNRSLPFDAPEGVFSLRGIDDAREMGERLSHASRLVVVGAGFLGLEVAAVAAKAGISVEVVEATAVPMGRALSAPTSSALVAQLKEKGIVFHVGAAVAGFETRAGTLSAVRLANGSTIAADAALVSIGIVPNVELAGACGLAIQNGVVVDERLLTEDPDIFAIGDCASFISVRYGARIRLESVQNAIDHGRHVARTILGSTAPYDALPWFWSDLDKTRLQIAGYATRVDEVVTLGDVAAGAFASFCFRDGKLVVVEAVNRPADYMAGRRCLAAAKPPARAAFDDPAFAFAAWVKAQAVA